MTTIITLPQATPATRVPTQRGEHASGPSGQRGDDFAAALSAAEDPGPYATADRDASGDAAPAGEGETAMPLTVAQIVQEAAGLLAEVGGTAGTPATGTPAQGLAGDVDGAATGGEAGLAPVIDLAAHRAGRTAPAGSVVSGVAASPGHAGGGTAAADGAVPTPAVAATSTAATSGAPGSGTLAGGPSSVTAGTTPGAAPAAPLTGVADEGTGPATTVPGTAEAGRPGAAVDAAVASTSATDTSRAQAPDGMTPTAASSTAGSPSGLTITGPTSAAPTAAPAHAAPAAPHAAVEPQALAAQLGTRLSALRVAPAGEHVLVLRVDPETFGPVRVVAHIGTEGVRIELLGASDQARDALRAALPDLRRDLAAAGLPADLDLGTDGRADGRADPRDGRTGSDGTEDRRRPDGDAVTATPDHPTPTTPRTHRGLDLLA